MNKKNLAAFMMAAVVAVVSCSGESEKSEPTPGQKPNVDVYDNPVAAVSLPDPTVIKGDDGYFYLYATEDIPNTPIFRSQDLVKWSQVGTAFTDRSRPKFVKDGGIWAPDINKIGDKYVLFYSMSVWGGEWSCGIGIATADKPQGPFLPYSKDPATPDDQKGKLFISSEIGVQNSIDPCYVEDGGKKYLFWGSFSGLYAIELDDTGLALAEGAKPVKVAGSLFEGAYVHKRGDYYYLFASKGTCCDGARSTYTTVVGRAENILGPYLATDGTMLNNHFEFVVQRSQYFLGTGHNSELITDKNGDDWMLYHAYKADNIGAGRVLMLDRIDWSSDGWPTVRNLAPSVRSVKPVF